MIAILPRDVIVYRVGHS